MDKQRRYPFLDFFRGVAVLWVVVHHVFVFFDLQPLTQGAYPFLQAVARAGVHGVDIFFVLSGFLITGILLEDGERVRVFRFYGRRCFKILPQYAALLATGLLLNAVLCRFIPDQPKLCTVGSVDGILPYFFFLQGYHGQIAPLAHTWSLAIEEHFYLVFPLLLGGIWTWRRDAEERRRLAMWLCLALIFIGNVLRYLSDRSGFELFTFGSPMADQTTLVRFDALLAGCLLKLAEKTIVVGQGRRVLIAGCWAAAVWLYVRLIFIGFPYKSVHFTCAYLAPALILIACLNGCRWFDRPGIMPWIGKNSYGIYIWHYIVILPFSMIFKVWPSLWVVCAYVAAAIYAGFFSTHTLEKYFLRIRDKVLP